MSDGDADVDMNMPWELVKVHGASSVDRHNVRREK